MSFGKTTFDLKLVTGEVNHPVKMARCGTDAVIK